MLKSKVYFPNNYIENQINAINSLRKYINKSVKSPKKRSTYLKRNSVKNRSPGKSID